MTFKVSRQTKLEQFYRRERGEITIAEIARNLNVSGPCIADSFKKIKRIFKYSENNESAIDLYLNGPKRKPLQVARMTIVIYSDNAVTTTTKGYGDGHENQPAFKFVKELDQRVFEEFHDFLDTSEGD